MEMQRCSVLMHINYSIKFSFYERISSASYFREWSMEIEDNWPQYAVDYNFLLDSGNYQIVHFEGFPNFTVRPFVYVCVRCRICCL